MSIPNIQLAFQGGGAKFAAMLPVADAFVTAQKQGQVHIKAVAGTSAGAICAALVACQADFEQLLSFLQTSGEGWVSKLIPSNIQPLLEMEEIPAWWDIKSWFKHRKAIYDVAIAGKSVLDGKALFEFFRELFRVSTGNGDPLIEKCHSKLTIIASNIVASEAVEHRKGALIPALTDSCALPVLFRSFAGLSASHNVDGGLCDNLPVAGLLSDPAASVFAVYPTAPAPPPESINNIMTYFLAMLSASINHSVSRSKAMISKPFRFEVETDLGLLDFREALGKLADKNWYAREKEAALFRIENFLTTYGSIKSPNDTRVADVIEVTQYLQALGELSDDFADHFRQMRSRFMVRVNCDKFFQSDKDAAKRPADTVTRVAEVVVLSDDARYYRSNVSVADDSIAPTIWSVRNRTTEQEIPIRALPLDNRPDTNAAKRCLIQFIEPRKYIKKGDMLEIRGVYHTSPDGDMRGLNFRRNDFFGFKNTEWDEIETAEIVLVYPVQLGSLTLAPDLNRGNRADLVPIKFTPEFRLGLGDTVAAQGYSAQKVMKGDKLYAQVNRVS